MKKRTKILTGAAVAAVGVLAATGTVLAVGANSDDDLTGSTLDRARKAALAEAGPGRVTGAEQEDGGGYELEITRDDGSEVDVVLDEQFEVAHVDEDDDRTQEGADAADSPDTPDTDDLTGEVRAKAAAAAETEVPGGIVTDAEHADGGGYEVSIVRPDGTEVDVRLDRAFTVTSSTPDDD